MICSDCLCNSLELHCVSKTTLTWYTTPWVKTAKYLRCGGIFKYEFVADLPLRLSAKEFWKSVNIWRGYGKSLVSFFDSRCIYKSPFSIRLSEHFWQHFYRAMLCIRGTSHGPVSVCPSVCPSQVGVLLKRLNVGSHKQHRTIAQGL